MYVKFLILLYNFLFLILLKQKIWSFKYKLIGKLKSKRNWLEDGNRLLETHFCDSEDLLVKDFSQLY